LDERRKLKQVLSDGVLYHLVVKFMTIITFAEELKIGQLRQPPDIRKGCSSEVEMAAESEKMGGLK
jgi:hypothetical protein